MSLNFDLISDLYLSSMKNVSWKNKITSPFCIIAGNVTSDHNILYEFFKELSKYYKAIFFIDGDLEHDMFEGDFLKSYSSLTSICNMFEKVIFLHENIIILNEATLMAINGWTTFDFLGSENSSSVIDFLDVIGEVPKDASSKIYQMSISDQEYLSNSIKSCQDMKDVNNLIVITNSVPMPEFVKFDNEYNQSALGNTAGNPAITRGLFDDVNYKVRTWLFGKYKGIIDRKINGIRFTNNPGINRNLEIYFPKIIKF